MVTSVPALLEDAVKRLAVEWESEQRMMRLWAGDASLWTGADEGGWLGWLRVIGGQRARVAELRALRQEVVDEGFEHAVLLGMGGSSLCPEVLRRSFGRAAGSPDLHVLDSTDPARVRSIEQRIDYRRTLFIVSSKSGTTLEPNIFLSYFAERARARPGLAGSRFVAVTDPGSKLEQLAVGEGFRHVFHGVPSIGGRYSALSDFGLVPAAVMGLDVDRLLDRAEAMRSACAASTPLGDNPGAMLGLTLAAAVLAGRDKITFAIARAYRSLGAWLEQLLAESTGKNGTGLIPVDGETVATPDLYGADRLFVHLRDEAAPDDRLDDALAELERAGHPVVRLGLWDPHDLGAEFFRWELATAVAGSVLGINPFDQPDVEASKIEARRLTDAYEAGDASPEEQPLARDGQLVLYAAVAGGAPPAGGEARDSLAALLAAHCGRAGAGDYLALLAYIEMSAANEQVLQRVRHALRSTFRVATCVGFGPRFLHSTGQAHKGGPNSGVFIQITCDDPVDVPVPGRRYSFGVVKAAQARGDLQVLAARGRRVLRLHVTGNLLDGLNGLADLAARSLRRRTAQTPQGAHSALRRGLWGPRKRTPGARGAAPSD